MSNKKQKIIKLYLDEKTYPLLFKLKNEEIGDVCLKIFKTGYNFYFNNGSDSSSSNKIIKQMNYQTDSIKCDLKSVNQKLSDLEIDKKMDQFSDILENLFGIANNSAKKGNISENLIYTFLRSKFKNYTIEETRHIPHHGDGVITYPKNGKDQLAKILLEIKNYKRPVGIEELNKLKYDMKFTDIKYSLFISLKSGFIGKKQMTVDTFNYNNKTFYILYIPNMMIDTNKLEAGLILIDKLMELEDLTENDLKCLKTSICDNLKKLDDLHTDFARLKHQYFKMERSIKNSLDEYYKSIRSYEINLKNDIDNIWKSINAEFSRAESNLMVYDDLDDIILKFKNKAGKVNKNLYFIFNRLKKNNVKISKTKQNNLWYVMSEENLIVGMIVKKNNILQIALNNLGINCEIDLKNDIVKTLEILDGILIKSFI